MCLRKLFNFLNCLGTNAYGINLLRQAYFTFKTITEKLIFFLSLIHFIKTHIVKNKKKDT